MKFSQTLLSSKIGSVLTKRPYDLNLSHKTEKIENPFHEILIRDDVLSKKECDSIVASICSIFEYQLATSRGPKFGEARRKNNRMSFADEKLAEMLWEDIGLKTMFIRKSGRRGEHEQQQGYYKEIGKNDNSAVQWKYVCAFSVMIFSHRDSGGAVLEQDVKGEF